MRIILVGRGPFEEKALEALIFPLARFKTFAFEANSFSMFLILNIEYPPGMQSA